MNLENDNVIGIVGGMGPEAGLVLFNHILSNTNAIVDQEHLSILLMSFPRHIVDRTSFLEGDLEINPGYNVAKIINKLEYAGAKVVGIACNTSYAPEIFKIILDELNQEKSKINLVNMPFETCLYIKENYFNAKRIGLMCTNGTYNSRVYESILEKWGYEVIVPDFEFQNDVIHKMIYDPQIGLKSNPKGVTAEAQLLMNDSFNYFKEKEVDVVILGCTELSSIVAKKKAERSFIVVDSTKVLALALIREATKI